MGKNHKDWDLLLVEQALEILSYYNTDKVKPNDYIFPLLSNDAPYAKFVTLADRDRMKPELRYVLYQDVSAKKNLINKYLPKNAEKAEITTKVSMHMSRHALAHIALESGVESSAIKDIPGHSNLATTERYMGSFDTSKTDGTILSLFKKKKAPKEEPKPNGELSKTELLKELSPEQIMAVISAINK